MSIPNLSFTYAFGVFQVTLAILDGSLPLLVLLVVVVVMVSVVMMGALLIMLLLLLRMLIIVVVERMLRRDATRPGKPTRNHSRTSLNISQSGCEITVSC